MTKGVVGSQFAINPIQLNTTDEIGNIKSQITKIVKSWKFRCLGIGKTELNQQIENLKNIAITLNQNTQELDFEKKIENITSIFNEHIKPNVSEKNYLELEANIISIFDLVMKITKTINSYKYTFGFTTKKANLFIETLNNRCPTGLKNPEKQKFDEIKDEILWKSTKEKISTLKNKKKPPQRTTSKQLTTKAPLSQTRKAESQNTESTPIIKNSKGTIQTLEEIKKKPNFQGTIVFKGKTLSVRRGGLDNENEPIGAGAFGFLLYIKEDGKTESIKEVIKITTHKSHKDRAEIEKEAKTCKELYNSPGVLGASDTLVTKEASYIRMEYAARGDLHTELYVKKTRTPLKQKIGYALSVLQGLQSIHSKKLLYKDLKPENMVLDKDGNVRLIDFGLVEEIGRDSFGGTLKYMAPEVIWSGVKKKINNRELEKYTHIKSRHHRGFSTAVDVYSFGIFLAELINSMPYEMQYGNRFLELRITQDIQVVASDRKNHQIAQIAQIAQNCLKLDPDNRPTIDQLITSLNQIHKSL